MSIKWSHVFFWLVAILLAIVWILCVYQALDSGRHWLAVSSFFLVPIGLILLFWLEGLEAAYGELRDKEPEQVGKDIESLLKEMQSHDELFVGQRELFVVVGILIISLLTDFDLLLVPLHGVVHIPKFFGLIFTSLIVFWFASVASKKLAFANPQVFLRCGSILWPLIRKPSWIGFLAPANSLVNYVSSRKPFNQRRALAPSRISYHIQSCRRYGYASDRIDCRIVIENSGRCKIVQKGLLWFLEGRREHYKGAISLDSEISMPKFRFARILEGPRWLGDNTSEAFGAIDALFDFAVNEDFETVTDTELSQKIRDSGIKFVSQKPTTEFVRENDKRLAVKITSPIPLPGELKNQEGHDVPKDQGAVLVYCFEYQGSAGSFKLDGSDDSWVQKLSLPTRKYAVEVLMGNEGQGGLGRQFAGSSIRVALDDSDNFEEQGRMKPIKIQGAHRLTPGAEYALPGATLGLHWRCDPEAS